MFSSVATGLFCLRNSGKTRNGDIGRAPVTVGQGASVIKACAESNAKAAKPLKVIFSTCSEIAKSDRVFNGLSKAVKFASENVNPLIVASSGLKVALADKEDRNRTIITESGCLAGMFLGEGWMKKNLNGLLEKLPVGKKWIPVIKGITFVAGSITASTIGMKLGSKVADHWDKPFVQPQTELSATKAYRPMDLKA